MKIQDVHLVHILEDNIPKALWPKTHSTRILSSTSKGIRWAYIWYSYTIKIYEICEIWKFLWNKFPLSVDFEVYQKMLFVQFPLFIHAYVCFLCPFENWTQNLVLERITKLKFQKSFFQNFTSCYFRISWFSTPMRRMHPVTHEEGLGGLCIRA